MPCYGMTGEVIMIWPKGTLVMATGRLVCIKARQFGPSVAHTNIDPSVDMHGPVMAYIETLDKSSAMENTSNS
jgi:hypothetical protein